MKPKHHTSPIVRINNIRVHNNADSLELIDIEGYQVVVKKGQFKNGELAVYVYPDSIVPQTEPFRFIWEGKQCEPVGDVPVKYRRITVRKFRGEWSEGLLLPTSDFNFEVHGVLTAGVPKWLVLNDKQYYEGDDVSNVLGITHYDPDAGKTYIKGQNEHKPKKRPKTLWGWFWKFVRWIRGERDGEGVHVPVYDVEALKNYKNAFNEGELVYITEKIHGSNARYLYLDGHMYAGSRTLWKAPNSNCVWRKALKQNPWIEEWCRAHEGYTLYGEVVPTQGKFNYGCKDGEVKFFAFDILTPEGKWEKPFYKGFQINNLVPVLALTYFDSEYLKNYVDGPSAVPGANHIREGVVVTPVTERHVHGLGRLQLKLVSNAFLEKDSK